MQLMKLKSLPRKAFASSWSLLLVNNLFFPRTSKSAVHGDESPYAAIQGLCWASSGLHALCFLPAVSSTAISLISTNGYSFQISPSGPDLSIQLLSTGWSHPNAQCMFQSNVKATFYSHALSTSQTQALTPGLLVLFSAFGLWDHYSHDT